MATMQDPAHPGESLRDALAAAGWTVTEAAAKLGCARQTFSRLLNGRTGISPGMALALERIGWSNAAFWVRRAGAVRPGAGTHPPAAGGGMNGAGRGGPDGRDVLLRAGRAEGHGRRRLGGRLEAVPLRLGVQGAARGPRRRLRPAPAVFAGAGEPAAVDRFRHGAVPDPHELDEQRQHDARVRAPGPGRRGDARPAEVGVLGPRPAAALGRRGGRSRSARRRRSRRWRRRCGSAGTTRRRWRTS